MSEQYNSALRDEMWSSLQKQAKDIDPQLALDIVGIFDPTPISDGASAAISLWKGEFIDALLGVASMSRISAMQPQSRLKSLAGMASQP